MKTCFLGKSKVTWTLHSPTTSGGSRDTARLCVGPLISRTVLGHMATPDFLWHFNNNAVVNVYLSVT